MGFWSQEREDELRKLLDEGLVYAQIAKTMGCSPQAISGKVSRLNLRRGPAAIARQVLGQKLARSAARRRRDQIAQSALDEPMQPDIAHRHALHTMEVEAAVRDADDLIPLVELQAEHCRYYVGDPRSAGSGFCGQPRAPGLAYCAHHTRKCFIVQPVRKRLTCEAVKEERELEAVG